MSFTGSGWKTGLVTTAEITHRALADIRESIHELRYYRAAAFVPDPGPDTDTITAIVADLDQA